jgi:general L-amino acid transport system substrate-binding protein
MKKGIVFTLTVILILSLFVSCNAKEEVKTTAETTVTVKEAAPTKELSTLEQIRKRGYLVAGVNASNPGFSFLQEDGQYKGFEVELAKAISVAVFGTADNIEFRPLTSKERFTALQSGEIDVLVRTATITTSRDTELGLDFTTPYFYDGQTFLVSGDLGITTMEELEGATIAVLTGSTTETNLAATMESKGIEYTPITYENLDEMKSAFVNGRVDALSVDKSSAVVFLHQYADAGNFEGLEETISKEPLGIAVRHGDNDWKDICQWTLYALFFGDEHGITSANIDEVLATTTSPEVKNAFGMGKEIGPMMDLSADWAYQVIKQCGNYGEIYYRELTQPMGVTRGLNKPWNQGGLLFALPFN